MKVLRELHAKQLENLTADKPAAKAICGEDNPALAAMVIVCSTLLTSDAALTNR